MEDEDLSEYLKLVKNDPDERDAQMIGYIEEVVSIHDEVYENGINGYNTDLQTLLLSFFERCSYYDPKRVSSETYERFASFLEMKSIGKAQYEVNMKKEQADNYKGIEGSARALKSVADSIDNPSFRVYLILLCVGVFKDIRTPLSARQKSFVGSFFKLLKV